MHNGALLSSRFYLSPFYNYRVPYEGSLYYCCLNNFNNASHFTLHCITFQIAHIFSPYWWHKFFSITCRVHIAYHKPIVLLPSSPLFYLFHCLLFQTIAMVTVKRFSLHCNTILYGHACARVVCLCIWKSKNKSFHYDAHPPKNACNSKSTLRERRAGWNDWLKFLKANGSGNTMNRLGRYASIYILVIYSTHLVHIQWKLLLTFL